MTCVLVRKYHIPYMFQDDIVVGTTLQSVDKDEALKEIGRVTSRAYDRSRRFFEKRFKEALSEDRALTPDECEERDEYARKRYREAKRRLDVGEPELTPEELICDAFFD